MAPDHAQIPTPMIVRPSLPTLSVCILVTAFLCQRHSGFMLIVLALPLAPWLIYSVWVAATKPAIRRLQLAKAGIWVVGVCTVVAVHASMYYSAQAYANKISTAIDGYIVAHGACPQNLEAVGIAKADLRAKLGYAGYLCDTGKPSLFYGSTFVPFEQESYDFGQRKWVHVND